MDSRTIVDVTGGPITSIMDIGTLDVHLSDGSVHKIGGFIAGENNQLLVDLRTADGSDTGDGPVVTADAREKFIAQGAPVPELAPTLVIPPSEGTPAPADGVIDIGEQPSSDPETPVVVANHIHVSLLRQFIDQIEAGERVLVHEIANALHAL